jgi:hypothetical protein
MFCVCTGVSSRSSSGSRTVARAGIARGSAGLSRAHTVPNEAYTLTHSISGDFSDWIELPQADRNMHPHAGIYFWTYVFLL